MPVVAENGGAVRPSRYPPRVPVDVVDYAAVKLALAADPTMDSDRYVAGKSAVLQRVSPSPT
jgi:GrpB-like predicted nucleotidyltransferase (UPF0157 family)